MVDSKYLTFELKPEVYGIPILKVKEIIGMMDITHVPRMPDYVKGVINLRGKIIPVIDLRIKFGLETYAYNPRTCIIVAEIEQNGKIKQNGLVVDTVSEVLNIDDCNVVRPPQYDNNMDHNFLTGIGKVKEKVIMLLDPDMIFLEGDMNLLKDTNEKDFI